MFLVWCLYKSTTSNMDANINNAVMDSVLEISNPGVLRNMDGIAAAITSVLPTIGAEAVFQLVSRLLDIGVEDVCDLRIVTEDAIGNLVKPIQLRKLLNAWSG